MPSYAISANAGSGLGARIEKGVEKWSIGAVVQGQSREEVFRATIKVVLRPREALPPFTLSREGMGWHVRGGGLATRP
jgi:hypothetical protein